MKKYILLYILLLSLPLGLSAQQQISADNNYGDDGMKGIVYDREVSGDFKLHTQRGWAVGVNFGRLKTYYLTTFFNVEIGELKHFKEFRQNFDFTFGGTGRTSKAFVFGKQNNLLVLRGGYGQKRYFTEKARRRGVAVGMSYSGGPSLGLLKPYYLDILYAGSGSNNLSIRSEKYSSENAVEFLSAGRIWGSSGFTKGLSEVSVVPGLHAKVALHLDWGAFDEFLKAAEVGIMADFFIRKMPIMVESPELDNVENSPLFINFFLNLQLGKRW